MAAKVTPITKLTNPGTRTFDGPREHAPFRLNAQTLAVIEDVAMGIEAGDAGLKSCAMGAVSAAALGASAVEVNAIHHRETVEIDDVDECLNAIGDLLWKGYSHAEIRKTVRMSGGSTHLLALERWCDRIHLGCNADAEPESSLGSFEWWGSGIHERRRRCERAMTLLRSTAEGTTHAAVLHIVYGWADPFVNTLPAEVRVALGPEFAPLARYTDAVEAKRMAMVRESAQHGATPGDRYRKEGFFAEAAKHDGYEPEVFARLVDLAAYRERAARADRILSSGDALRAGVGAFPEPAIVQGDTETRRQMQARVDARKARLAEHRAGVSAFVTAIRLDANRMLTAASEAFKDTWHRA